MPGQSADNDGSAQATLVSTNPRSSRLRVAIIVGIGLACLVLVVVLPLTLIPRKENEPNEINPTQPTFSPTIYSPTAATIPIAPLQSFVATLPEQTKTLLQNPNSPQAKAFKWLYSYPDAESLPEWKKLQLFSLVTFYYAFDGPNWPNPTRHHWLDETRDECIWFANYSLADENGWYNNLKPCRNDSQISAIYLSGVKSDSEDWKVPFEVALLPELAILDLTGVGLTGSLEEIGILSLTNLEALYLADNLVTGTFPANLSVLTNLKHLSMKNNLLTSTLPTELGSLTNLETMLLHGNNLTGPLPSELGLLTSLRDINLAGNSLTGSIPSGFARLSNLRIFNIGRTNLTGSLPPELGNITLMERPQLPPSETNNIFYHENNSTSSPVTNSNAEGTEPVPPTNETMHSGNNNNNYTVHPSSMGFFEEQDPWRGMGPEDVVPWNKSGSEGLNLLVINALEDKWLDIFYESVMEWEEGTPDFMQLTVERSLYDPECEPEVGALKVCNANYGATEWRGINQVLLQNGYIVASTSKMNDYYLEKATDTMKLYTMCHNIGHGFGLPHADEDFFNANLGNCMDFANDPVGNTGPDESNFLFLKDLYGTIPPGK